MDWTSLRNSCELCRLCSLANNNVVFSEGSRESPIMFVGEAPGEEEHLYSRTFIGPAGQLLRKLFSEADIVNPYLSNICKCHPPNNRRPSLSEIQTCSSWLVSEITLLKPKVIVTLGNIARHLFHSPDEIKKNQLSNIRGKINQVSISEHSCIWIPTFHPAYLLRHNNNPQFNELVLSDLILAKSQIEFKTQKFISESVF